MLVSMLMLALSHHKIINDHEGDVDGDDDGEGSHDGTEDHGDDDDIV